MKAVIFASAFPVRAVVLGLVLAIGPVKQVSAEFIPLLGGLIDYTERVTIFDPDEGVFETGTLPNLAESVQGSAGGAFGSATNTAGTFQTPASTFVSANSNQGYRVEADTDITFDARLIRLHPDAPGDIGIPLFYTSSLSATDGAIAELNIRAGETLLQESVNGSSININSSLSVLANEYLRIEIVAGATSIQNSEIASASTPVFTIDPNFMVSFLGRTERAADLYTLAVKPEIGFAGNFETVTPFTDGCLPDPSLLTTSGTPRVKDGDTVTCLATDPSGFRSYGNDPGGTLGILNELAVVVTTDATVETSVSDTETFGILGQDNGLFNQGIVRANGENTDAIFFAGDGSEIANEGVISTSGNTSTAVFLEGDSARTLNEGKITTGGFRSSAVVLEGDDATISNRGTISTEGDQSSGLVVEGLTAFMENEGAINTIGNYSVGMTMLSIDSERLRNGGTIETSGEDAMGILALGLNHAIENLDVEATTLEEGQIKTSGARAYGIALGLQEPVIPPGVEIPLEALAAASGSITNSGFIETRGDEADAIHAFANNLPVINSGELKTSGKDAHGISIKGNEAQVDNTSILSTAGIGSDGIYILGDDAVINHGDDTSLSTIDTTGDDAKGIFVLGDRAKITIDGESTIAGIGTVGEFADAVLVSGDGAEIISTGELIVLGNDSYGINGLGDDGRFENMGSITAGNVAGRNGNSGIKVAGDRNRVYNNKTIVVESDNSFGVSVQGDDAVVANGDTQHRSALIGVVGNNAVALRAESNAPTVTNDGELAVEGDNAIGISAVTGIGSTFQVSSDNQISVAGNNVVGMSITTSNLWGAGTAGGLTPTCSVTGDGKSKFINCGNIEMLNSAGATGMLAIDTTNTTIENQERIVGSGSALRGIEVFADSNTSEANNYIGNVDLIELSGDDSIGINVAGHSNTILHGTDTIKMPNVPLANPLLYIDPFGETLFVDGTFTQIQSEFDKAISTSPIPIIPRGNISVIGANAVGIAVDGNDNRIAITINQDPDAGPGEEGLPTAVTATGANAIGVKLTGNNNLLVNGGDIVASGIGVLGGDGSESVNNKKLISGGVQLNGGDDVLIIEDGSRIVGTADGGLDYDTLIISAPKLLNFPATPAYEVNGSKFVNFEQLEKVGAGNARLTGTLVVDDARILQGDLQLKEAYLRTTGNTVTIAPDGTLSGNGTLEGRVEVNGGKLAPGGGDIGGLNIVGDLLLNAGILGFEADSPFATDQLEVSGDVTIVGGVIQVILGFTPTSQDVLDLLVLAGTLNVQQGFDGIVGVAKAGSGVALGTQFTVDLGGQLFQSSVTSIIPIPSSIWLFGSTLAGLFAIKRKRSSSFAQ